MANSSAFGRRWPLRVAAVTLLAAQVLVSTVAASADARLEARTSTAHAVDAAPGFHDSHSSHDHRFCQLCRAISAFAGPAAAPERGHAGAERWLTPAARAGQEYPSLRPFFPLGPRAPPPH